MNVLTKLKISFYLEMYKTNKGLWGSQNVPQRSFFPPHFKSKNHGNFERNNIEFLCNLVIRKNIRNNLNSKLV